MCFAVAMGFFGAIYFHMHSVIYCFSKSFTLSFSFFLFFEIERNFS